MSDVLVKVALASFDDELEKIAESKKDPDLMKGEAPNKPRGLGHWVGRGALGGGGFYGALGAGAGALIGGKRGALIGGLGGALTGGAAGAGAGAIGSSMERQGYDLLQAQRAAAANEASGKSRAKKEGEKRDPMKGDLPDKPASMGKHIGYGAGMNAGMGAGTGALIHRMTGGRGGKGALIGAAAGGLYGAGMGALIGTSAKKGHKMIQAQRRDAAKKAQEAKK